MPLVTQLKQAGLVLDIHSANVEVLKWLRDVANVREHGTTGAIPAERWREETTALIPAPQPGNVYPLHHPVAKVAPPQAYPVVDLQHPLSVYEAMLS